MKRLVVFLYYKKKVVEWMDNVNRYGYVYIYQALLLNQIESWRNYYFIASDFLKERLSWLN